MTEQFEYKYTNAAVCARRHLHMFRVASCCTGTTCCGRHELEAQCKQVLQGQYLTSHVQPACTQSQARGVSGKSVATPLEAICADRCGVTPPLALREKQTWSQCSAVRGRGPTDFPDTLYSLASNTVVLTVRVLLQHALAPPY